MAQLALVEAYEEFMETAKPFIRFESEAGYAAALQALEQLLELAQHSPQFDLDPLIELIGNAIAQYEAADPELAAFLAEAEATPADIAMLRTLMRQHGLTGADLPEIGDKTMVSKVLNGKRALSRQAIERLAARFGIRPGLFLGG